MQNRNPVYFPVLRLKQGEYNALVSITTSVADKIAPRFVLPPPTDRDPEAGRVLSQDEFIYSSGKRIGEYWPMRICYVEARYLFKEYGYDNAEEWLPKLFDVARKAGSFPVPVASLDEAIGEGNAAFKKALPKDSEIKLGLRIRSGDLDDDLKKRVGDTLAALGTLSQECVVFLDFADADVSDYVLVSEVLGGAFQTLQEIGVWARIVFQATNYPEKNPALPGTIEKVSRTEWQAWTKLIGEDHDALQFLAYGDYGADSAKFVFASGGAIPIRHLRYCGDKEWVIARGKVDPKTTQAEIMKGVAQAILNSGVYAGRAFSRSDDRIYQMAKGLVGGGNAQSWREINTAHHITKVVTDLGKLYDFTITPNEVEEEAIQEELFPAE